MSFSFDETVAKMQLIRTIIKERTGLELSRGICPMSSDVNLRVGFIQDFVCDEVGQDVPSIIITQSAEKLFDLYYSLLQKILGEIEADDFFTVLTSSHKRSGDCRPQEFYVSHIDFPVILSMFCEHEKLLQDDGCFGVSICSARRRVELQLDEHKTILVCDYSVTEAALCEAAQHLASERVPKLHSLQTVINIPHIHETSQEFSRQFGQFRRSIGARRRR